MTRRRRCQWPGCKATAYSGRTIHLQAQQREAPFACEVMLTFPLALCSEHAKTLRQAEEDPTRRTGWWSLYG